MIRQIWLLLLGAVLLAFVGGFMLALMSLHDDIETELAARNTSTARALAGTLSRSLGRVDAEAPAARLAARSLLDMAADTGLYQSIVFTTLDGRVEFSHRVNPSPTQAPFWFVAALFLEPRPGIAPVDGDAASPLAARSGASDLMPVAQPRQLGTIEVISDPAMPLDALWRSSVRLFGLLGVAAVTAVVLATLALQGIRRPLKQAVSQAHALADGRYVSVPEPAQAELRDLTRGMNAMVGRVRSVFEAQAAQLESLRLEANGDPLTGVANRKHFIARLTGLLARDDGPLEAGLVLLRLRDLAELNRSLGHAAADGALNCIAHVLQTYADRVKGCFVGRLNGSDFALSLPVPNMAYETGTSLADTLRVALPALGPGMRVAIGVAEVHRSMSMAALMGSADAALARSETRGAFTVEVATEASMTSIGAGEGAWRHRIGEALASGRTLLATFVVVDAKRQLVHVECNLRLQLDTDGAFEPAAHWLPLAVRGRQTPMLDERSVALALADIHRDGQPRCVNMSPASLHDSAFAARLRSLLQEWPRAARLLSIEVGEAAAVEQFALLQEFSRQVRPSGVKVGLEHAGERLARIDRLFEAGLDYVKLDASMTQGCAGDDTRLQFLKANVAMLHALTMQVYAEGVASATDAAALWSCGIDGISGPWAEAAYAGSSANA
jgi:diguanylate cyclase (GGDEF)-like protein